MIYNQKHCLPYLHRANSKHLTIQKIHGHLHKIKSAAGNHEKTASCEIFKEIEALE